ncbi:MAG: hypothetical protein FJW38_06465 [Acidobacteria bacterium]|nr:hypothetical protein [Acidobacteriota bacterium]
MSNTNRRRWASIVLFSAFTAGAVMSQPAQPKIRRVTFYTVKADRVGDFLAATKEYAEAAKKAGSDRYLSIWSSISGNREFAQVRYYQNFAEFDQRLDPKTKDIAGQLTSISARIMATVESSRTVISTIDAETSLPIQSGQPQAYARVLQTWVRPGQIDNYRALIKAEMLPAAKKAGMKLYSRSRVRMGGSTNEFNSVTGFDKWAELDGEGPIVKAIGGQAAYEKFLAKLNPMITRTEVQVYRFMKDQSYLPPGS